MAFPNLANGAGLEDEQWITPPAVLYQLDETVRRKEVGG